MLTIAESVESECVMYTSVSIENFRCFDTLTVEPLERFNLVAGKNNVGKTALLEALMIHHGYYRPAIPDGLNGERGLGYGKYGEYLHNLFLNFNTEQQIAISCDENGSSPAKLLIECVRTATYCGAKMRQNGAREEFASNIVSDRDRDWPSAWFESEIHFTFVRPNAEKKRARAAWANDGPYYQRALDVDEPDELFIPPAGIANQAFVTEILSEMVRGKRRKPLIEFLQCVEPRLQSLEVLQIAGTSVIHADIGADRLVELHLLGAGTVRLLGIALALTKVRGGILLIDEFENGIHHSVLIDAWKGLAAAAREMDVQVFATTHSHECIQAAHDAFSSDNAYDFRLHRLERIDERIEAVTFDRESLDAALESGWEVR